VIPVRDIQDVQLRTVLESGRAVVDKEDELVLYAPVRVRGQVVGAMRTRRASDSGRWTGEDIRLVEELAEQLSLSLESARSYQETQLAAQRERLLGEIGGHIRQTLDLESILRTTSQEVRQALDLQRVVVRLGVPPAGDGVDLDREDLERVDPLTSGVGDDGHEPPTQPTDSESGGSND
ncbi:MAG: hypothetical protein JW726_08985, partial [Anaerolineales bacterium]|nr:hypothetical protein [Anaerolineales bacterium]